MGGKRKKNRNRNGQKKNETIFETHAINFKQVGKKQTKTCSCAYILTKALSKASSQRRNKNMFLKEGNTNADETNLPPPVPKQTKRDLQRKKRHKTHNNNFPDSKKKTCVFVWRGLKAQKADVHKKKKTEALHL